jgi:formiminotetrahydrofolate cyclodeaminase
MPERVENEDKTAYEKRVRFKAIQNALAAQLAPILLGESGRTISDADRVRVIALLGGFADFSKAGVLTTEEEMNQSINELERIIRKYQSSSKQDAETFLTRLDEASNPLATVECGDIFILLIGPLLWQ